MDNDIQCAPAPTPPSVIPAEAGTQAATSTDTGPSRAKKVIISLLALALLAGVAFALVRARHDDGSALASAEAATVAEESTEDVATATDSGDLPAECVGDIVDLQRKWYCTEFLPFAKKAASDHGRIDRLEAAGRNRGNSGFPLSLWVFGTGIFGIGIGIGILMVCGAMRIHLRKQKSPTG